MFIKIHKSYRDVIAICDEELIGKKFEDKERVLEVKESFYLGDKISEKELLKRLSSMYKEDATFNIVGKNAVKIAIESGIVDEDSVKEIKGIPFILILL